MSEFKVRTDLALEARESFEGTDVEISGVVLEEDYNEKSDIKITRVIIENEEGESAMGKPIGTYITLEAQNLREFDESYHREVSEEMSKHILELLPKEKKLSVLVVGLGNREATPDALGPLAVGNLSINRHLIREFGRNYDNHKNNIEVSAVAPGVMAQTGMETVEAIKGIVHEIKPDVIIAIDALAARSAHRLNTTIQITDTGISPGSGVGNHRSGLTKESLGIPVIAIGIPTVIDTATIVNDTMDSLMQAMSSSEKLKPVTAAMAEFSGQEKYQLIRELIEPHLGNMYVTPKDVDETIKSLSFTVSESLNMAFSSSVASR